mgnify:CR=1 FL=1
MATNSETVVLSGYSAEISDTDVLRPEDINPILLGLYGEVGGIMSTAKKHIRERSAYPGFRTAAEEEFGDTLWYLAALCRRVNIPLEELFATANDEACPGSTDALSNLVDGEFVKVGMGSPTDSMDKALFKLGISTAALLGEAPDRSKLSTFVQDYLAALNAAKLSLSNVAQCNLRKARGAFLGPRMEELVDFDADFAIEEQLPRNFKIRVNQRESGRSYLQWNGVFIGDPLTDNIADPDGYRFHDVFHLAFAAILHWSPVMRVLIKQKRKSKKEYDEAQDGGRAIVVEEGLTAWIFSRAKELNYFEGQDRVSLGMLKTISEFVSGYEVSKCPLKLWERAILEGYDVFRQVRDAQGGWIIGDRALRTIRYMPLEYKK